MATDRTQVRANADGEAPTEGSGTPHGIRPGKRAQRRAEVEADILKVAREHLASHGAAALSLRAVARDLGMVSSGIYRYVESRDELLTRLIVDSYTSLAEHVASAHARVDPEDLDERWRAVGRALREWALRHPHDFALLYGSPVPDYEAPAERTTGPGTAVQTLLLGLVADAAMAGRLVVDPDPARARAAVGHLAADELFSALGLPEGAVLGALAAWTLLLGSVTGEVFGHFGRDTFPQPETYFEALLDVAERLVIAPAG